MASRIKGLTIEIEGNTTKLADSLSKVNKSLYKTQTELKDVNQLLKLDPKNTELLNQKQELLSKAINDTEEKLKKEKEAMEALKNAPETEDNTRKQELLTREIVETESKLKSLKEESKEFGSVFKQQLQETGKQLQETGESIKNVGDNMTKYVTAPIMALGGASLASFNQVDKGFDIIVTKTGASGDALASLQDTAKNLAKDLPTDFETIGTAVGEVNTRFGVTGNQLEDLSGKFIQFAQINGTDVNNTIDTTQKIMSAYGLTIDDVGNLLDTFNVVGQNTGVSMDTLEGALVTNATAFQELGLSAQEGAVLIGQLEMSGADANTVLGGMSKALKSATAEGKPLDEALSELQNTIANSEDEMAGLQASYDLFGKSGAQVYQAVKDGSLDFANLSESIQGVGGSVTDTYNETISPMERFQTVLNQLIILGYEIGEAIMPMIEKAIDTISPIIEDLTEKWNNLSPGMQEFIVKTALIVAGLGPLVSIVGSVISLFGSMAVIAGTLGLSIGAIAAPIAIAVSAIAGLVAMGVTLYKNMDTIKKKASELWQSINQTFQDIKTSISTKIEDAKTAVGNAIQAIKDFFNFNWELPKLKMPHFSVSGSANPLDWLSQGIPKISVDWYKGAYDNPVIFNTPTVLPTINGYKGFGDGNGAEVVMSLQKLQSMMNDSNGNIVNINVYGAQGQSEERLATIIEQRLAEKINNRKAVF